MSLFLSKNQISLLREPLGDGYVTCAYALMNDYSGVLRSVIDKCRKLGDPADPTYVLTDFELAVIRACRDMLGAA